MSPWMSTASMREYLDYRSLRSVYRFIERHGLVGRQDGRRLLFARADVERALQTPTARPQQPQRHRNTTDRDAQIIAERYARIGHGRKSSRTFESVKINSLEGIR